MTPLDEPAAFDLKTAKPWKAYWDNCTRNHLVYYIRKSVNCPDSVMCISSLDHEFQPYEWQELTAAPEHDLIPVSALTAERELADSLAEALRLAKEYLREHGVRDDQIDNVLSSYQKERP